MDKRIIAIILALIVAVPAAVCMAQYDSEAADDESTDTVVNDGSTEEKAIELGTITVNVGGSMNVGFKNNETAYAEYNNYTIDFKEGSGQTYSNDLGSVSKLTEVQSGRYWKDCHWYNCRGYLHQVYGNHNSRSELQHHLR